MTNANSVREIENLAEMRSFAHEIASAIGARALILLNGPMGAGKTQFTKFFMEALGNSEACSPSFAIHNNYPSSRGPVEHMDLYRLESEDDLESTGFWDFFRARQGIVLIEWASRMEEMGILDQLPRTWPMLVLEFEVASLGAASEKRRVHIQHSPLSPGMGGYS